jgi:acyl-CoA thioesterase-1
MRTSPSLRLTLLALIGLLWPGISTIPAASAAPEPSLPGTYEKLATKKKLVIAYLGASVMAGAGASAPEKTSWRALVTQGLQAQYPGATIEAINTSVGGKGADYANFHFPYDTLPKQPDLIFTDAYCNGPYGADLVRCNEGLIRQMRKALPDAEIVFLYIYNRTGGGVDRYFQKGEVPPMHAQLHALTRHYGLPDLDLGKVMFDEFKKAPGARLLADDVHPSDAGHRLYAEAVLGFLKERIVPGSPARALPAPFQEHPAEAPNSLDAPKLAALGTGWKVDPRPLGFMPSTLTVADPAKGAELSIPFTGSMAGLYWLQAFDGGQVEWSVDGQPPQRLVSGTEIFVKRHTMAITFDRLKVTLPYGEHRLTIRALPEKPAGSLGNVIKIGAVTTQ